MNNAALGAFCLAALTSMTASAAPIKGAYRLVSMSDGKQTLVLADAFKKVKSRGEVILGFDGDKLTIGLWLVSKQDDEPTRPAQTLVSLCRGQVSLTPSWAGKTFSLASGVAISGWSDSFHVIRRKQGDETTKSTWTKGASCDFNLDKATYSITITASDASGPKTITIKSPASTMLLERSKALGDIDAGQLAKAFLAE